MVGDAVIDAVAVILPVASAVETVITTVMLADARAFERVPIPSPTIYEAVALKALPIMACAQDDALCASELGHAFHRRDDQGGARPAFGIKVQEIARIK